MLAVLQEPVKHRLVLPLIITATKNERVLNPDATTRQMETCVLECVTEIQAFGVSVENISRRPRLCVCDHILESRKQEVVKLLVLQRVILYLQATRRCERYSVGRVGQDKVRLLAIHQKVDIGFARCITAHKSVPSDNPHITTLNEGCLLQRFRKVIVIVFNLGFVFRKEVCEFLFVKTRKTKVEVQTFQLLQFYTQKFFVPTRIKRHSVIRQDVRFLLRFGEMVNEHTRHFLDAFRLRRHNSAVSGNNGQIPVNDDGINKPELTQRRTEFQNLFLTVGSGIVCVRY